MRTTIKILLMVICISFFVIGCEEILTGIGIGAAGSETLISWKENLEAKRVELDRLYDEEIARMEAATDPNELAFHKQKAEEIQLARAANFGARVLLGEMKKEEKLPQDTGDWLEYGLGLLIVAITGNEYRKRRGFEKAVNQLEIEADPVRAKEIDGVVKSCTKVFGK